MGIFSSAEEKQKKAEDFLKPYILPSEILLKVYTNYTSHFAITDKRLIGLDTTTEFPKKLITSIAIDKISLVQIELGSSFALKHEVNIYTSGKKTTAAFYDKEQTLDFFNRLTALTI